MKYFFLKIKTLLILLCFITIDLNAQTGLPPTLIPPSPNAASIGKYGDIPLNYSSGLPNVNIPLFTLNEGSLQLPIAINYNYSGYKSYEQPAVLGRGWSLLAGGLITRMTRNLPDEYHSNGVSGYLNSTAQVNTLLNTDGTLNCTEATCPACFNLGQCDGQPDIFYFNFGNNSGKFFFGDDGLPHVIADRKLKIAYTSYNTTVPLYNGIFDNIFGFTITTEDGTVFHFGDSQPPSPDNFFTIPNVEFSYSQNDIQQDVSGSYQAIISAWMLNEIDDVNGNKITFTYQNDYKDPAGGTIIDKRKKVVASPYSYIIKKQGASINFDQKLGYNNYAVSSENLLTKIQSSSWQVNLAYNDLNDSSKPHTLSSISLSQSNGQLNKSFALNYSSTDKYCVLSSLNEQNTSADGVVKTYSFLYNDAPSTDMPYGIDYWGYYNGVDNTGTYLIPVAPYNANRNPSFANTVCLALKTITYPTGGTTSFQYELNQYSYIRENSTNNGQPIGKQPAGGIRIKSIIDAANNGTPPVEKDYYYDSFSNSSLSSGVILAPLNNYLLTFGEIAFNEVFTPNPDNSVIWEIYKSDPFYQLSTNPVYYFNVKEVVGNTLRTDYTFTSHFDYPDELGINYGLGDSQVGPYGSFDFARPLQKNVKYYRNSDVVSEKQTNFQLTVTHRARTLWRQPIFSAPGATFQLIKGESTIAGFLQKTNEVTTNYYPTAVVNTVSYEYDPNYYLVKKQTHVNSDTKATVTTYKYPFDFATTTYQNMVAANIITPVIEQATLVENNQIDRKVNNYDLFNSTQYKLASVQSQTSTAVSPYTVYSITKYTANGNPQEMYDYNLIYDSYKWGYNNQYPIAEVKNASVAEFYYEGFEESTAADVMGNKGHTGTRYSTNTTVSWTKPNTRAYKISYWYRVSNAWSYSGEQDYTGSSYTLTKPGSDAYDDIRIYPADAQMTTYTYSPLVGMTSSTDAKGLTNTFEYDSFNRLMDIKDKDGNIIKAFCYNYLGQSTNCFVDKQVFYNTDVNVPFTKNCGPTATGSVVYYHIPAGTFMSLKSQADADQYATNDLAANGQNYANNNGTCTPIICYSYTLSANQGFSVTYHYKNTAGADVAYYLEAGNSTTVCAQDGSVTGGPFTKGAVCP